MAIEQLLANQVLQITVLASVIWLTTRTLTRKHAHLSYVLWLVVLLKCVTPPIWSSPFGAFSRMCQVSLSQRPVSIDSIDLCEDESSLPDLFDAALSDADEHAPMVERASARFEVLAEAEPDILSTAEAFAVTTATPISQPAVSSTVERAIESPKQSVLGFSSVARLATLWLGVAAAIVIWTMVRAALYVRNLKIGVVEEPQLQVATDRLSGSLGLKKRTRLLVTSCRVGPAVVGLFRPMIVVPQFIVQRSTAREMEPILAHELIHIRRGDLWVGLFRHLARSLWWFHPLVWKTSSSIRRGAERCCDEEVIASLGIAPQDYARALLGVLELKQELKALPVVPGVRPFDITSKRLERIMQLGQGSRQRTPRWCWAIALLLAVVSLPGAGLMLGEDQESAQTRTPAYNASALLEDAESGSWAPPLPKATRSGNSEVRRVLLVCQILSLSTNEIDKLQVNWRAMPGAPSASSHEVSEAQPETSSGWGAGRLVVEKRYPILYALLTDEEVASLKKQAAKNTVTRPQIMTVDDHPGKIEVGQQRQFVVGINEQGELETQKVNEGLTGWFRPKIAEDGVRLAYRLVSTKVRSVQELDLQVADNKGIRLQIPELENSTISGVNQVPSGATLLVRVQVDKANAGAELMLAIVKPMAIVPRATTVDDAVSVTRTSWQTIPWGRLQKKGSKEQVLGVGDILGVYIRGLLGPEDQFPPVHESDSGLPSMGFPIPIRSDGTIPLPLIDDPKVAGLTIPAAEKLVGKAYKEDRQILPPEATVLFSLIRCKPIQVVVFREDRQQQTNDDSPRVEGTRRTVSLRGGGFELKLPNAQADLLRVLAKSGGLPAKQVREILIYRQDQERPRRIAIRFPKGRQPKLSEEDITLRDGDIVVVGPTHADAGAGPDATDAGSVERYSDAVAAETLSWLPPGDGRDRAAKSEKFSDRGFLEQFYGESVGTRERWKLTLEECISMGLQNSHVSRTMGMRVFQPNAVGTAFQRSSNWSNEDRQHPARIPLMLARLNNDLSSSDAEIKVRDHLHKITRAYWNLYFSFHNLDAARTGLVSAHATWKQTKTRAEQQLEGGEAANEAQARAQYFAFKLRQERAQNDLVHQEQELRHLLGLAASDGRLIHPIDKPSKARMEFDWDEIKKEALQNSPELRRQRQRVRQQELQLNAAKKQLLANADAKALYGALGLDGGLDAKGIEPGDIDQLFEGNSKEWQLGLQFEVPVGFRAELAQVRALQLQLVRAKKRLEDQELEISHQLSAALRRSRDAYRIAQTQLNAILAYRDQVNSVETAYQVAQTVPLDTVLDAQSHKAQAEIDYRRAIVQYQLAVAEIHFRKGTLARTLGVVWSEEPSPPELDEVLTPATAPQENKADQPETSLEEND